MTDETPDPLGILCHCDNEHCERLYRYLVHDIEDVADLEHEDIFYPLRHHHQDGLAIDVSSGAGGVTVVWGPGDFIYAYRADRPPERYPKIDPGPLWQDIQNGFADIDVVVVGDDTEEAHDG